MRIGLFYGSSTCYTEMAAEKIQLCLEPLNVELFNIKDTALFHTAEFDVLIFGIPTWDYGQLQEDWDDCWDELDDLNLDGKTIALFGLGDQEGYGEWFLDALGYLYYRLLELNNKTHIIGQWAIEGYQFEASKALSADQKTFVGLALDYDNQATLVDTRIEQWCLQLKEQLVGSI